MKNGDSVYVFVKSLEDGRTCCPVIQKVTLGNKLTTDKWEVWGADSIPIPMKYNTGDLYSLYSLALGRLADELRLLAEYSLDDVFRVYRC